MAGSTLNADQWVSEYVTPYDIYAHGITDIHAFARTPYQQMSIVSSGAYGKALVLDGKWQSCTGDEFLYHEPLVHPACVIHGNPQSVLVLGGGEGATIREALRWNSVKKVVMVDLDGAVVDACKEHLPEMHQGAFDDPRTELVIGDAIEYLQNTTARFDVVISDLSDPIENGPSFMLFTREYHAKAKAVLNPGGVFVLQAGSVFPMDPTMHARNRKTIAQVFTHTASMVSFIPTYACPWSFVLGSDKPINTMPDPAEVDTILESHSVSNLRMFDGIAMLGLMQLPKHIRTACENESQHYSLKDPPKFFGSGVADES